MVIPVMLSIPSIVAICIMVGVLLFAYLKKVAITFALIIANLFVFFISSIYTHEILVELGFSPMYLSEGYISNLFTLFTSMFVHAGYLHILGNMLVLFFIGMAFEQRVGRKRFLIIYLTTGICGAITFSIVNWGSPTLLVGASGAIFGILGAFAAAYPRDEVVMPIPVGIMFITRMRVVTAAIIFALFETLLVFLSPYMQDNTAHFAHLGGLVSGMILAMLMIKNRGLYTETSKGWNTGVLEEFAQTPEQFEILEKIKNERIPEVRRLWLNKFMETARCPKCGKPLLFTKNGVICKNCGFRR
ncbi:MAG TPA: rhomboid family intramembrane serine protease [Thermoplasmatales archaeon]|nr:rhomboid family intramembrane serine protease [Thermoplasmatales archaeon]